MSLAARQSHSAGSQLVPGAIRDVTIVASQAVKLRFQFPKFVRRNSFKAADWLGDTVAIADRHDTGRKGRDEIASNRRRFSFLSHRTDELH